MSSESETTEERKPKMLFAIAVIQEADGSYTTETISPIDRQKNVCRAPKLSIVLKTTWARIRKRHSHNLRFPPAPPSPIILPNGNGAPKLVVLARN